MNPLPTSINPATHIAHALGWTLLHFCWQGAIVALILACILALLSRRSAQPRYLAACCALLLMVALPLVTFTRLITAPQDATQTTIFLTTFASATTDPTLATPQQPLLLRLAENIDRAMPTLLILWLAGVILLLARLAIGLIIARRMKSATTQPPPRELLHAFHQLARRIGVSRPIRLLNSALVQVPTVIGWLHPVVLIPLGCLAGLSPTQIEAVLAHELAHIRRHDYLVSVLQSIVEALLFYHPAVWWVSRQIRREREHCCDDLAVAITGDPLTYARALSLLEEHRSTLPALTLEANGGILTMRIKRLLAPTQNPAISQLAALTLLGIVIAATATCITTAAHAQKNPAAPKSPITSNLIATTEDVHGPELSDNTTPASHQTQQQATAQTQTTPTLSTEYEAWLDQDVRWIITPAERANFLQLTNDQERDTFIQQFWTRRNAPDSAPNTFRAEHYRRIAYANQHFGDTGIPGWDTDRGRIFIVNGPPNTIDSHPSAAADDHPYETWSYTSAPGLGQNIELKFVDVCFCGNYQLQPQSGSGGTAGTAPAPISKVSLTVSSRDPDSPYPPIARAAHVSGTVLLLGTISKTGTIEDLKIVSGPQMLRASAVEFVKQRTYRPLLINGSSADVPTKIEVTFLLDEATKSQPQPASIKNSDRPNYSFNIPDKQLYDNGLESIRQGQYELARFQLQTLVNRYPDSQFQTPAKLAIAESWRKQGIPAPPDNPAKPQVQLQTRPNSQTTLHPASYKPPTTHQSTSAPEPLHVPAGVIAGTKISGINPIYPPEAKVNRIQGAVVLRAIIAKTGAVDALQVVSGPEELRQSALEAVSQWTYRPYLLNGQPIAVETTITINYTLDPSDSDDQNNETSAITPKEIGGSVSAPVLMYAVQAEFTEQARKDKISGKVLVHLWVDEQGRPAHVYVVRGLGKGLDEKAVEAVKQYRFAPAMENGRPVLVALTTEVKFQIF